MPITKKTAKTVARKTAASKAAPAKKAPAKAAKAVKATPVKSAPAKRAAAKKAGEPVTVTLKLVEPKRTLAQYGENDTTQVLSTLYPRMSKMAEVWGDDLPKSITVTMVPNW